MSDSRTKNQNDPLPITAFISRMREILDKLTAGSPPHTSILIVRALPAGVVADRGSPIAVERRTDNEHPLQPVARKDPNAIGM
ncbi:MAG: hypothetical protein JNG88_04600 [Phycisphaerales bacterium]|nr:hypothetical protein [Phycisphaerales bacterium]